MYMNLNGTLGGQHFNTFLNNWEKQKKKKKIMENNLKILNFHIAIEDNYYCFFMHDLNKVFILEPVRIENDDNMPNVHFRRPNEEVENMRAIIVCVACLNEESNVYPIVRNTVDDTDKINK
ncbi:mitochondrial E3 ubiquitin protein ligase 1-like isoform X1, partial [Aphis craccivora]